MIETTLFSESEVPEKGHSTSSSNAGKCKNDIKAFSQTITLD